MGSGLVGRSSNFKKMCTVLSLQQFVVPLPVPEHIMDNVTVMSSCQGLCSLNLA